MVKALYEGTFSVGLDKKFIRIGRDASPRKGALKLSIQPFLIRSNHRVILFDAGLGEFGEGTSTELIRDNLSTHGLEPEDVSDIFMSHLHYDHLGGLAGRSDGYWQLTFPEASLWVNRHEWESVRERDGATDDEEKREFFHFLDARADLRLLEGDSRPIPEVRVQEVGGHTPHSQVLYFEEGDRKYLMAGDIIGRTMAVRQKFAAKFDAEPKVSMRLREQLKELAVREGYHLLAYHESQTPIFRLRHEPDKGYRVEPA